MDKRQRFANSNISHKNNGYMTTNAYLSKQIYGITRPVHSTALSLLRVEYELYFTVTKA